MKISSLCKEIKVVVVVVTLGASLAGCAPHVASAPFATRVDTVRRGDLLGPFDGRVVDVSTGKPLSGALVFATWRFEIGKGLIAPAGADSAQAETDADGAYLIPQLSKVPGGRTRITHFTLIVYKRGYVAYRSDRRFDTFEPRSDFTQHDNLARLERFSQATSHVGHVRFVGGSGALRRALQGEIVQASLELTEGRGGEGTAAAPAGPPLEAGVLLSADELKAVTGYEGEIALEKLTDLVQTSTYDSRHFKAVGKGESYDAAIRVWKLSSARAAEARYSVLLKEVPHAETRDEIADRSLRGHDGKILAAAALERERHVVVQLTCGVDQCSGVEQAVSLLRRVMTRVDRLGKEPAEEQPAAEKPAEEKPVEEQPFRLRQPGLRR